MLTVSRIIDSFFSFPAYVMLPLIIFAMALIVRMRVRDAFLVGLRLGVGFAGVFIVFDFFVAQISPAVEAISRVRGLDFPVLDVGWPPLAAITWSSLIGPLSIPFVILVNVIMVSLRWTRTVFIDLWNVWQFALMGALVQAASGSLWLGMGATLVAAALSFKTSDFSAGYVEREMGLRSVSISPMSVTGLLPFSTVLDWVWGRIPWLRDLEFNPEKDGKSIGLIGEPMVLGLLVGLGLAIAAGYSVRDTLELAVHIAAVMFLLPRAAGLIGEGFAPLGEHLKAVLARRFGADHELYFAMDTGVIMSHKSVIATGLLLMPIALVLAFLVPGNRTLPLGDLPNLISVMSVTVLASRGNVIRAVLTGIPLTAGYLWIASAFAPIYTRLSAAAGVRFETTREITAFTDGGNHVRYWLYYLFEGNPWAIAGVIVMGGMLWFAARHSAAARREAHSQRS
jgi:PTS system galactitol-specific IIC component